MGKHNDSEMVLFLLMKTMKNTGNKKENFETLFILQHNWLQKKGQIKKHLNDMSRWYEQKKLLRDL